VNLPRSIATIRDMIAYSFSQRSGEVTSFRYLLVAVNAVNRRAACMDSFDGTILRQERPPSVRLGRELSLRNARDVPSKA
jgi:hypothetical protein